MESEGSLPHSQVPATCPYAEPDQSCTCHTPFHFLKIHFNIVLPPTPGFSKWSLSLSHRHRNPVYFSASISFPSFDHPSTSLLEAPRIIQTETKCKDLPEGLLCAAVQSCTELRKQGCLLSVVV